MVTQYLRWMLQCHSIRKFRVLMVLASGFGIAATLFIALLGSARANQPGDAARRVAGESCLDLKAAALAYTDEAPVPQWALIITYTHENGIHQTQSMTPTVNAQIDSESISLPIISRRDRPTDGQYDLYVDVQHRDLFEPSGAPEAVRLANAVEKLWNQLNHVALDAVTDNNTEPAFSCNCTCLDADGMRIEPGKPMLSPNPGADPAAAFESLLTCIRFDPKSGNPIQTWQVGYEKPDWRIVVVGQVEFQEKLARPNSDIVELASWLKTRYQELIAPDLEKVLIILFDPRNRSDQPIIAESRLSRISEALQGGLSMSKDGNKPEISIVDYRDETLVSKLAPPIETVLTVGLPKFFSKTKLDTLRFGVIAPPCTASINFAGTDVTTMYAERDSGDLVDLWQELSLIFIVLITVVFSWTLLLSTIAYRQNWFGIREKLELAFEFPWYKKTANQVSHSPDGASGSAKNN